MLIRRPRKAEVLLRLSPTFAESQNEVYLDNERSPSYQQRPYSVPSLSLPSLPLPPPLLIPTPLTTGRPLRRKMKRFVPASSSAGAVASRFGTGRETTDAVEEGGGARRGRRRRGRGRGRRRGGGGESVAVGGVAVGAL